jgi:transposase-like protein
MPNEYPVEVRREARRLWLTGRYTDAEVAAKLGIPRPDTIRDWRHEEGWAPLANDIAEVLRSETKAAIVAQHGEFRTKYDQLGKALESRAIRGLNNPALTPRDLKAIAGTLAVAQRIREKAIGAEDDGGGNVAETIADIIEANRRRKNRLSEDAKLGRCLPSAGTTGDGAAVEPQPPPPGTTDDPAVNASP